MDFLVHSRATADAARSGPDQDLTEQHWSYMDRYAAGMTARGPTLSPDRESWTGSMHVVSLPSATAVHEFVSEEPYQRAGRFGSHDTWLFTNLIGRTMWEHPGPGDEPTFLVFAPDRPDLPDERLLMCGELHTLDGAPAGFGAAVALPDRTALDHLAITEVHAWEPGGRR